MTDSAKKLFNFFIFGCVGMAVEIFFTAALYFIEEAKSGHYDFQLRGHSYVWMFFIYGLLAFLFPPVYGRLSKYHIIARLLIYAAGIFMVEFVTGFLLEKIVGQCPWKYTGGMNVLGYIRLDYLPYWMLFGWFVEWLYRKLNREVISKT